MDHAEMRVEMDTIESPPDGGFQAWRQVFAGHLVVFNTWGYINSFGIFQPYYTSRLARPPSDIAWIGSVQILLVYLIGILSGQAIDRGYFRWTISIGLFLQVLGIMMTSISKTYWQLVLAQGVCQGIGNGLVFCPTIALISTYFSKRRTVAVSCAACGAATGGMVFPAIARQLLHSVGFAWTVRAMALVVLVNSIVVLLLAKTRIPPRKSTSLVDLHAFKELPYALFACGSFFSFWAVYYAYYYIRVFAKDQIHIDEKMSFSILLIINGVGVPGRLIPAFVADRLIGPLNTYALVTLLAAVLLFAWIFVSSLLGLIAFAVMFGFFGGGVQSLFPAVLPSLTNDLSKAGIRIGMTFMVTSFASLTGPPLAGTLIEKAGGGYLYAQLFGGVSMFCGSMLLASARIAKKGLTWRTFV